MFTDTNQNVHHFSYISNIKNLTQDNAQTVEVSLASSKDKEAQAYLFSG
jgi:hypothetical protein